jgi:hypothetical protein
VGGRWTGICCRMESLCSRFGSGVDRLEVHELNLKATASDCKGPPAFSFVTWRLQPLPRSRPASLVPSQAELKRSGFRPPFLRPSYPPQLLPTLFLLLVVLISYSTMSLRTARTAMSSLRNSSTASKQRLSQVQRHFSSTTSARQEIQEAYILSASRTPTAKV